MTGPVLVLGADDTATEFLAAVLQRGGITAASGRVVDAAARVAADAPALVLIDTDLGAVQAIRALPDPTQASVPVVVLGADTPAADAADAAIQAGATHYVPRPIIDAVLINGVRTILGTR